MVSTGQRSASFEYEYTIEVLAMDYPEPLDTSACQFWHGRACISLSCYSTLTVPAMASPLKRIS
jgi:hypothetical protein